MSRSVVPTIFRRALATQAVASTSATPVVHLPLTLWPSSSTTAASPEASTSYVPLPSHIFSSPSRPDILHQCVTTHLTNLRQGTSATKGRSQVRGSGRKIMRQKGTGRARVGDVKSPIRRGGGHAFAKVQKDWTKGLNRKVWELGVRTALSERWRRGELSIIPDAPVFDTVSTRSLVSSFRSVPSSSSWSDSLFLLSSLESSFALSARNLPNVDVRHVLELDVYSILQGKRVVMDIDAVQILVNWLGKQDEMEMEAYEDEIFAEHDSAYSLETGGDGQDGDGGMKRNDVVIEQEEAPITEQREHDPLDGAEGQDRGDAIREHVEDLAKQGKTEKQEEDRPSPKDVL